MIVTQGYRYELDPNDAQSTLLVKHAGTARFAWNWALTRRIERFESLVGKHRFSDAMADHRAWNAWKKSNAPWVLEVSKCVAQEKFRDLDRSFRAFWKAHRVGGTAGFPKFKKKGRDDSFRLTGCIHADSHGVKLPRIGRVRTKERTKIAGRILSGTIRQIAGRWFVSLTVERERSEPPARDGLPIGIDVGLNAFAVLSDGDRIDAPKPLAKSLRRLKRLSRRNARRKKGSKNKAKSTKAVAKLHWRVANQRRDFLHKTSTRLAKTKPAVVIEDLNVRGLIRNKRLSRDIADVGWSEFRRMLAYKSTWHGMELIVADRFFASSKRCSGCGHVLDKLPLAVRAWQCPACGVRHERDLNAARNLAQYGTASRAETAGVAAGSACG